MKDDEYYMPCIVVICVYILNLCIYGVYDVYHVYHVYHVTNNYSANMSVVCV